MESGPKSHRDLIVWQKAMTLAVAVYWLADAFPRSEQFGLTSQVTRAAVSIPANIAEGRGRTGLREYANFLSIARGSLAELDTLLDLGVQLGYITKADLVEPMSLIDEVGRMLTTMGKRLRSASGPGA